MLGIDRRDGGSPVQQQHMTSCRQDMPLTFWSEFAAAAARSLRIAIFERAARER